MESKIRYLIKCHLHTCTLPQHLVWVIKRQILISPPCHLGTCSKHRLRVLLHHSPPPVVFGSCLSEEASILPYNSVQECPTHKSSLIHVDLAWGRGSRIFLVRNPYAYRRSPFLKSTISFLFGIS
jgi:hypothetical protein